MPAFRVALCLGPFVVPLFCLVGLLVASCLGPFVVPLR